MKFIPCKYSSVMFVKKWMLTIRNSWWEINIDGMFIPTITGMFILSSTDAATELTSSFCVSIEARNWLLFGVLYLPQQSHTFCSRWQQGTGCILLPPWSLISNFSSSDILFRVLKKCLFLRPAQKSPQDYPDPGLLWDAQEEHHRGGCQEVFSPLKGAKGGLAATSKMWKVAVAVSNCMLKVQGGEWQKGGDKCD